ncbi:FliM/FliN family flagellar motor C-terminal domain-containing protein [Pantoea sp. Mb-10]|uniref:flagellar motor switch protein FliM n=1 Tax=unclassified Pantoea TaxID=2630326 RepID=UPI001E47BBBD|nr:MULTISPECIES: flagellar motor switch protein FliM [unclassified Pantoea]MCE0489884.1 FliM/FliN family flagellar motor C-terminal domain-containing protein [Pantoea sp. Mb-10]MCE0501010.1 FliM/FliN family flagellar motor C-terminal domain-containing protein [Pantoea sp. Pb-8]
MSLRSKKNKIRIYPPANHPELMPLDVGKLGRPYHKVPSMFKDNRDRLDSKLGIYFLKKFRVNAGLKDLAFHMDCTIKQASLFSSEAGNLGFTIDRALLLTLLHDYYGLTRDDQNMAEVERVPVTKTEERMLNKLAYDLVDLVCDDALFPEPLHIKTDPAALITHWSYRIDFFLDGYEGGQFSLLLDAGHVDRLLCTLRQPAEHAQAAIFPSQPCFRQLPVRLRGRLASLPLTVADLARLQPNDVLPFAMNDRIPLLVGNQPLFSAVICEDRGKLYFSDLSERASD